MRISDETRAVSLGAEPSDGLGCSAPSQEGSASFGAALYVGAKSMVCRLYALQSGELVAHTSASGDYASFTGDELRGLMTDIFETLATSAKTTLSKIKAAAVSGSTAMECKASNRSSDVLVYAGGDGCEDYGCDVEYILVGSTSIAVGEAYFAPCLAQELGGDFICSLLAADMLAAQDTALVAYSDPAALESGMGAALALGGAGELSVGAVPAGASIPQAIERFLDINDAQPDTVARVILAGDLDIELPKGLSNRAERLAGAAIEGTSAILVSEDAEDELCRIVSTCKIVAL